MVSEEESKIQATERNLKEIQTKNTQKEKIQATKRKLKEIQTSNPKIEKPTEFELFMMTTDAPSQSKFVDQLFRRHEYQAKVLRFQSEVLRYACNDLPKLPGHPDTKYATGRSLESFLLRQPEFVQRLKHLGLDNIRSPPYNGPTIPTVSSEEWFARLKTHLKEQRCANTPRSAGAPS